MVDHKLHLSNLNEKLHLKATFKWDLIKDLPIVSKHFPGKALDNRISQSLYLP